MIKCNSHKTNSCKKCVVENKEKDKGKICGIAEYCLFRRSTILKECQYAERI